MQSLIYYEENAFTVLLYIFVGAPDLQGIFVHDKITKFNLQHNLWVINDLETTFFADPSCIHLVPDAWEEGLHRCLWDFCRPIAPGVFLG